MPEPTAPWADVARVVDEALDLDPGRRAAFVERSCASDPALRQAVEDLLGSIEQADPAFLTGPAALDAAPLLSWVARRGLAPGTTFGPYEITGVLGRGGMATVYLADDHKHHRRVAVKVLDADVGAAIGREWFLREIEIAAALHHPHILPLHDSGAMDGLLYYVMPHVEGESLRQRLVREGAMPLPAARRILQEVAGALDYAHRQGVVHRDIKPENILLQDGQAIVADFGIARAIATGVVEAGRADTIPAVGTPASMSPDQARGEGPLDGRTDLYALGCVLYEMLSGAPPFSGPSAQAVLDRHAAEPAPPLAGEAAPARVGAAIRRALSKSPQDRFATAGEFVAALGPENDPAIASTPLPALRRAAPAVALAGAVAIGLTRGVARSRAHVPAASADSPGASVVAVLPFRVPAAAPELARLRGDVADRLASGLSGDGGPRAAARRATLAAWRRVAGDDGNDLAPGAAMEVGRAVGAGRVMDGSMRGDPAHLTITASLLATADGRQAARAEVDGPGDSLPALVDRLAGRLLALGAGPDSILLTRAIPASLPALRAYLAGREAYRRGRMSESLGWFQQATVLDSTFAPAAFEVFRVRRRGDDGRRARRLALAGRDRLVAADQSVLDILTGPPATGPEWIDRWQAATVAHPAVAEAWYGLGDAYFHNGLSAGVTDPFRYAGEAMRRGWAIDSAQGNADGLAQRSPFVADPLRHLVELAQVAGDTAAVRRMVAVGLAADSTGKEGWYLRWQRAVALGDAARRRFWAAEGAVDPEAFGRMFEFIESSGIALEDYTRAAELDTRHWEASGPAGGLFERSMVALDGGRPRESARHLAEIENSVPPGSLGRPMGWRMGEAGDPGIVGLALYWGADTVRGGAAARRLAPLARGVSQVGDAARDQLEARCVVATWRGAHGDWTYAAPAIGRLRGARVRGLHGVDSTMLYRYTTLCAALLDAERATALRLSDARRKLDSADVASRAFEITLPGLGANLRVARVAELQGDLPLALRAVRRRAGVYGMFPSWYLSTYLREEGRLAALTADTAGAVAAYRHYLALRPRPEPETRPEVEAVRARLAQLAPGVPRPGP
jgi:serine/threonine-protein kinase